MNAQQKAIAELIEAVEAGDDDSVLASVRCSDLSLIWNTDDVMGAYRGSLDAALALHEALLCMDDTQYGYLVGPRYARIVHPSCGTVCDANGPTPARAWLIAILKAYAAQIGGAA